MNINSKINIFPKEIKLNLLIFFFLKIFLFSFFQVLAVSDDVIIGQQVIYCNFNKVCELDAGENITTCPSDCEITGGTPIPPPTPPTPPPTVICGDGVCDKKIETCETCPADCGECPIKDTTPPVISEVSIKNITWDSATIFWKTDEPTSCQFLWGKTIEYEEGIISDVLFSLSYSKTLTFLLSKTTYHFKVICKDESNNQSETKDYQFITLTKLDLIPPANVTNLEAVSGDSEITLRWINPIDEDFKGVKIIRNRERYPQTLEDGILVYDTRDKFFIDKELTNEIEYYYTLFTYDENGNYSSGMSILVIPQTLIPKEEVPIKEMPREEIPVEEIPPIVEEILPSERPPVPWVDGVPAVEPLVKGMIETSQRVGEAVTEIWEITKEKIFEVTTGIHEAVIETVEKTVEKTIEVIKETIETVTKTIITINETIEDIRENPIVKEVMENPVVDATVKTVSTGAVVTVAVSSLSSLTPLVNAVTSATQLPFRFLTLLGIGFGFIRHRKEGGVVYDSVTKQPLDPAIIILKDKEKKEIKSMITDLNGRFTFLVPPGQYYLEAQKTHYQFPTQKIIGKRDEIYDNIYKGELLNIDVFKIITVNIPMDPLDFDWNELAKKAYIKFNYYWELFKRNLPDTIFILGFLVAIFLWVLRPTLFNKIIIFVFIILFILRKIGFRARKWGFVVRKEKRIEKPLAFALLKIFYHGTTIPEIGRTITDIKGRYYLLIEPGLYDIIIEEKKESDYEFLKKFENIKIKKGVLNKDFKFNF